MFILRLSIAFIVNIYVIIPLRERLWAGSPTIAEAGVTGAAGALQLWGRSQQQRASACLTKLLRVLLHERLKLILQVRQMTSRRAYCPPHCAGVALIHEENR